MNNDRINELYKGEILSPEAQERARRRINWLVSYATGQRVLDLGCSQGIASILLGREGFEVVGVDIQRSRIEYALTELASEEPGTRARVTFQVGNGVNLSFEDGSFDTVLLGEVLEHQVQPLRVLAEAVRVVRPEGRILVTTPVGLHPHHDHKQTFEPSTVIELLMRAASVQEITIVDGYFRAVLCHPDIRGLTEDQALLSLQDSLAEMLITVQRRAFGAHKRERAASRRKAELERELQQLGKQHLQQVHESDNNRNQEMLNLTEEVQQLKLKLRTSTSQWQEEQKQLTDEILRMQQELNKARTQVECTGSLELENSKLRHERDVALWRHRNLRLRKWWRIGVALGSIRHRPLAILSSFTQAARIAFGPSQSAGARPVEPPELAMAQTGPRSTVRVAEDYLVTDASPVPAHMIVAATALEQAMERRFSFEWISQPVTSTNWSEVLYERTPDLLLISDAGWDEQERLGSSGRQLMDIVSAFRVANIPTVYWDTQRSSDVTDRLPRAQIFDLIVCTFPATVEAYKCQDISDVHLFKPAVQTRVFSPTLPESGAGDVISLRSVAAPSGRGDFADAARKAAPGTFAVEGDDSLRTYRPDYVSARDAKGYKAAVVELGESPNEREICRLLEVLATKTPLVVGGTVPEELGQAVVGTGSGREAGEVLRTLIQSAGLREQMSHRAWRHVREHNSIATRVNELLRLTGLSTRREYPSLTFMIPTNRPQNLRAIFENLGRQTYPEISAVLAIHGIEVDVGRAQEMALESGLRGIEVIHVPEHVALGEVFNRGFAACSGDYFGKMDDDDYYGPEYASDLMAAFEHTSADIVGKWTHYAYSQALDSTLLRYPGYEHTYQELVAISTLIIRSSVLESVSFPPMPRGSGSRFLREASTQGAKVYSADRFNYVYNRYSTDSHEHTWPMADYTFAAKAEFVCQGRNLAVVDA